MSKNSGSGPSEFNLADIFEFAVDIFGDREMVIIGDKRASYLDIEDRANRLAHHLASQGIGPGDHIGIYAFNCMEWVEAMFAIIKLRAVWININYRYVEKELAYLCDNGDIKALIHQRQFAPRVANVIDGGALPLLKHCLIIEDDSDCADATPTSVKYEEALAAQSPARDFAPRSGDDLYILFTGGTTGMPKGVVWRQEDVFFGLGGGIDAMEGVKMETPGQLPLKNKDVPPLRFMHTTPLMHGACQWGIMNGAFTGRATVLVEKFDADKTWEIIEAEKVFGLMITGDAMARPLIDALDDGAGKRDLSSLMTVASTAAIFSPVLKKRFFEYFPNLLMIDGVGASESGTTGMTAVDSEVKDVAPEGLTINPGIDVEVLNEDLEPVKPGSGEIGKLARSGNIPLRYHKAPKKSAETFVVAKDGKRYSIPGDFARVEADGRIVLLGRGSACINSGGMKIFPEEVEQVIKGHEYVFDVTVVGVPDERWGKRVAAVVEPRKSRTPDLESVQEHCRKHLASFKIPREMHLVDKLERSPSGKPDYPWAEKLATARSKHRSQA